MPDPKVSFVVLSYNFAPFLEDCIRSILHQEGSHDFEIVLVDDASTDGTEAVLERIRDPRLHVIRHRRNLGHAATANEALSLARGCYIARIDGDDRYRPDYLNKVLPNFEKYKSVGLIYGDAALMNSAGSITAENSDRVHGGRNYVGNELVALLERNFICAPTVIARREAWQGCLPVPSNLAFHDWYFTVMIARKFEFLYLNKVLADYRVHSGNMHSRITKDKTEEPSIFWMLDHVFGQPEESADLETAKRRACNRIYGAHYRTLADKYFGLGMNADARRCYWKAIGNHFAHFLDFGVQRRLMATVVGREPYELGKSLIRSMAVRRST